VVQNVDIDLIKSRIAVNSSQSNKQQTQQSKLHVDCSIESNLWFAMRLSFYGRSVPDGDDCQNYYSLSVDLWMMWLMRSDR